MEKFSDWQTSKEVEEKKQRIQALTKKLEEDNKNFWLYGEEYAKENSKEIYHYLSTIIED